MGEKRVHMLSVDVEDAVNQAMRNFFHSEMEPTIRVYDNTMRLLDLFAEYRSRATFFILGEVAKKYPELIKNIAGQGHELGIHGYSHTRYTSLSREALREEIRMSKSLVEEISGQAVVGHRAPEFSIGRDNAWVLEILKDEGIEYDSSIFPVGLGRYGWPGFINEIGWFPLNDGRKIIEVPLTTCRMLGKQVPVGGGGYLRMFPFALTNHAFKKIQDQRPVNVYLHPYEIDPPPFQDFYMEAISKSSLKSRLKLKTYWLNRYTVMPKLLKLLKTYSFDTLQNVIRANMDGFVQDDVQ